MQTTGIFRTHRLSLTVEPGKEWLLVPFGDVHRSAPLCHIEKWKEFLNWCQAKLELHQGRVLFLGMGDYDDLASASERQLLNNPALHESTKSTLDDLYKDNTNRLCKEIAFMEGHMIGCVEGNHYGLLSNTGITTTQLMCERLKCKYLGVSAFIRIAFHRKGSTGRTALDLWVHHGKGASRLVGGSLNRVQQMAEAADADIYLMGHDHKKSVGMSSKLVLTDGGGEMVLRHRKQIYGRTGSFLKGYEENCASYIADSAMSPTDLGNISISMTPTREQKEHRERFYIDLQATL